MSNTKSTQQIDMEKAKKYFDNLSRIEVKALIQKYYPNALQVTGSMYLEIWRKETQPTTTDNEGELKCTPGEWYKNDNMILTKGTPHNRIGLMYIRGSVDREFRQKVDEEMEANLDLCVASKDLYNALLEVSPLIDGLINRTPSGKQRDELCDMNIKVKTALSKANVNYKP